VHGDKELVEKLGRNDACPCARSASSRIAASKAEAFVDRDHYFRG
jgi:hypothetical protein